MATAVEKLLTIPEAAERLGCRETKLYAIVATGAIPSTKIGKRRVFEIADVDAYRQRQAEAEQQARQDRQQWADRRVQAAKR